MMRQRFRVAFPRYVLLLAAYMVLAVAQAVSASSALGRSRGDAPGAVRFRIKLSEDVAPQGAKGRLLVFMSDTVRRPRVLGTSFMPDAVWVAAQEIPHLAPGRTIELDPGRLAYPRPFSEAPAGRYHVMALLDTDHNYVYRGLDEGDLYSRVVTVEQLDPSRTRPIELELDRRHRDRPKPANGGFYRLVEVPSPLLSEFWGRPIKLRAAVLLPPDYFKSSPEQFPALYRIHAFTQDHLTVSNWPSRLERLDRAVLGHDFDWQMAGRTRMVHIYPDASFETGHTVFADSQNNGSWGRALVEELIPELEKRFRIIPDPRGRFLTGHSSGGWSALWLQVRYPDFFGGVWATAPDPVDFRSFTGIDLSVGGATNAYRTDDGKPRGLVRMRGEFVTTFEQFARYERVLGDRGGQLASFEWVFSPRGDDGEPRALFDRRTGDIDDEVRVAWENYDIRLILERNWETLGPKLRGKLHVYCGANDNFRLEEAVELLGQSLKRLGSDATIRIIPDCDHFNLKINDVFSVNGGLEAQIENEVWWHYEKSGTKP